MREVYLDNSATTEVSPEALAAYVETSKNSWGNPSSRHNRGKEAEDLMEDARDAVRHALGAKDGQVIFTSGGTEANNLAILGRVEAKPRFMRGGVVVTTAGEHSSVARPLEALKAKGLTVVEIPTRGGVLDLDALTAALTPAVCLVTMMAVNNETGARYPLGEVPRLMHKHAPDAVLHIDATQAFLKVPLTVTQ
ncbi:MAG: cysteine desulfurase family protein, partial [Eubacteriales bacterium]